METAWWLTPYLAERSVVVTDRIRLLILSSRTTFQLFICPLTNPRSCACSNVVMYNA